MSTLIDLLYNPNGIYNLSREFLNVGIIAANKHLESENEWQGTNINTIKLVTVPATNISFALELSLKGLLLLQKNEVPKTHSLLKLFNTLTDEIKLKIQQKPMREVYSHYFIVDIGDDFNRTFNSNLSYVSGDLREIENNLQIHDNTFVDFRYFFEVGQKGKPIYFNYYFMINFTHNCLETLFDLINKKREDQK